jgi:hypothetical protein
MKRTAFENLVKRRNAAQAAFAAAKLEVEGLVRQAQLTCKHEPEHVLEAPYQAESLVFYAQPDFRVCTTCGFAEEGWNCGYQVLRDARDKCTRDEGYRLKIGPVHPNRYFVVNCVERAAGVTNEQRYEQVVRGLYVEKNNDVDT